MRHERTTLLSDHWYALKKTTFECRRSDGSWQEQTREHDDRGNGAAVPLYDLDRRTVILTRQFRDPAFVNGHDDLLIEAAAGLLDDADAAARIRAEAEEKTGYRARAIEKVVECFMSPGSVTERLFLFIAPYTPADRVDLGGGLAEEGEDIDVLELPVTAAMAMVADGRIRDAKTIILLQHLALGIVREASA